MAASDDLPGVEAPEAGAERAGDPGFVAYALAQQRRIDLLLAGGAARRSRLRSAGRRASGRGSEASRTPEARDPEFRKNLGIFRRLISGAIDLHLRAADAQPARAPDGIRAGAHDRRGQVLAGGPGGELRARITLPADVPLVLKVLLAHRFALEQLLIELADREYLAARLAEVYDERRGTHSTWRTLYSDHRPALLPGPVAAGGRAGDEGSPAGAAGGDDEEEPTRRRLARLMRVKEAEDEVHRARWELKRRVALRATWVLAAVGGAFAAAVSVMVAQDVQLWSAVAAGAAGAALGGLVHLRDEITLGAQVRQFLPFFVGEVIVGAIAGVVVFLVADAEVVKGVGPGTGAVVLAFAIGFSEAAFLGLLARIAATVGGGGA